MIKKYNMFKHQGDIGFHPVQKVEGNVFKHNGSVILARGEHTGHKHVITVADPKDMDMWQTIDGGWFMTLLTEAEVTHEQHGKITLAPGTYQVKQEREYDWFQKVARTVID